MLFYTNVNRYQRIFVITGILIILCFVLTGFVEENQKNLEISADGKKFAVQTSSSSVKRIIKNAGIELNENDGFIVVGGGKLKDGSKIEVIRAIPITIVAEGKKHVIQTGLPTVAQVLKKADINYSGKTVSVDIKDRPRSDVIIHVLEPHEKIAIEEQEIDYKVVEKSDNHLDFGKKQVITSGEKGKKRLTYKESKKADGSITRELLAEIVLAEPKEEIVSVGRKNLITTSRGDFRYKAVYQMQATAYTPFLEGAGSGYTATGVPARRGVVAVDPRVIPLGSHVYIPGYGHAIAADTGGDIKGSRIDVCIDTYQEAIIFGRRSVTVYVLE